MTIQSLYIEADAPPAEEVPPAQLAKRQQLATQLCLFARNGTAWTMADKQALRELAELAHG